jgi:hypothetical protein
MMTLTLTITAEHSADLWAQLQALSVLGTVKNEPAPKLSVVENAPPAAAPSAPQAVPSVAAPASVLDAPTPRTRSRVVTEKDVRERLQTYMDTHGEPATVALLKQYGDADRLSKVNKDKWAALYAAAAATGNGNTAA